MENKPLIKSQNSFFRKFTSPVTKEVARGLIKFFPGITADKITHAGLWGVATGAALSVVPHVLFGVDLAPFAATLIASGSSLDVLDGAVAQEQGTVSLSGALLDVMSDRKQETTLALARIASASMRRDSLGVITATAAGLSNPLPSYYRARVEEKGYFVPEGGTRVVSALGTRPVRAILGTAATAYPELPVPCIEMPMQPFIDTLSALSNIVTTFERVEIFRLASLGKLHENTDDSAKELGRIKSEALLRFIVVNSALMLAVGTIGLINAMQS